MNLAHRVVLALLQGRKALRRGCFAITPCRRQRFGHGAFPARFDDALAHRPQRLAGAVEVSLGAVVLVVGQELRQVARADQLIHRARAPGQAFQTTRRGGGDDAVVGADLGVVPGPRAARQVQMRLQRRERRVGLSQRSDNRARFAVLAQRQVAAIAARVGDQLVGFVQRLGDVEGFLGAEAELLRADFLQRAEIERQGCRFALLLGLELQQASIGGVAHGVRSLLRTSLIKAAALVIAKVVRRLPLRGERGAIGEQLHVDGPERHRDEIGDAAIAVHHQTQRRRLHAAHRQHALITGLAAE